MGKIRCRADCWPKFRKTCKLRLKKGVNREGNKGERKQFSLGVKKGPNYQEKRSITILAV
jgi:hypothetical protein